MQPVARATGTRVAMAVPEAELVSAATQCRSILVGLIYLPVKITLKSQRQYLLSWTLKQSGFICPQVCTGVYNPRSPLPGDAITEAALHGHRDLVMELDLVEPNHVVEVVEAAVDLLLQQESSVTSDLCPL